MRKIKKWLTLTLASMLSLSVMSGCSFFNFSDITFPWDTEQSEQQKPPYVPGPAPETTDFTPVLRFVVASDMHVSANNPDSQMTKVRFKDMFTQMNAYADAQSYNRLDAVLLAGDITDGGTLSDLATVKRIAQSLR